MTESVVDTDEGAEEVNKTAAAGGGGRAAVTVEVNPGAIE